MKRYLVYPAVLAMMMALCLIASRPAMAQIEEYQPCEGNLILNWDLEAMPTFEMTGAGGGGGNIGYFTGVDFDTDYTALDPSSTGSWTLGPEQYFTISALAPNAYHSAWATFGDHTTGFGQMMIVNASPDPDKVIWEQTVTGLIPFATYMFSYHVALSHPANPPKLTVYINDTFVGEFDTMGQNLGEWVKAIAIPYYAWTDTAVIKIIDTTDEYWGDDFTLDDFELCPPENPPPPPSNDEECVGTDLVMNRAHIDVGDIGIVIKENGDLEVTYAMAPESEWCMTEMHLQVGAPFPMKNGNAIPGQFEYAYDPAECIMEHTFVIPAAEVPAGDFCIAAHAALMLPQTCYDYYGTPYDCSKTATGWNLGPDFPGKDWSMKYCIVRDECESSNLASVCDGGDENFAYNAVPWGVVNCAPPSLGFEATATNEFGDKVQLKNGTGRELVALSVAFNSYGCSESGHWYQGTSSPCVTVPGSTFTHPITASIYDTSGTLLAQVTQTETIPFRPSADAVKCASDPYYEPGSRWWNPDANGGAGGCQYSIVKVLTFGFEPGIVLPDTVVWTVEFNTSHSGKVPIGEATACFGVGGGCGYDSLNVGYKSFVNAPFAGLDLLEAEAYRGFWSPGYPPPWGVGVLQALQPEVGYTGYRPLGAVMTK